MNLKVATVGIDDPISVAGRQTTLRAEYQLGKVTLVRGNRGPVIGQNLFGHWAMVQKDWESTEQFQISSNDFKLLSGR